MDFVCQKKIMSVILSDLSNLLIKMHSNGSYGHYASCDSLVIFFCILGNAFVFTLPFMKPVFSAKG